jgi:16S rRNA (guanine527-N7)-methyltransferase
MTSIGRQERSRLEKFARSLSLDLSPQTIDELDRFVSLLLRWNKKVNLVSRSGEEEVALTHVADSLAFSGLPPRGNRIVDVGAGGGFPGLISAICRREVSFTLVESRAKKVAFLREARRELGLQNVEVCCCRVEDLAHERPFDGAVSRATFSPRRWARIGRELCGPIGMVWLMLSEAQAADFSEPDEEGRRLEYVLPTGAKRVILSLFPEGCGKAVLNVSRETIG